jgi:mannose-6-phosphate isomerase-like protein (cupin superfamily)
LRGEKTMKKLWLICLLALPLLAAMPSGDAPEGFEHWTAASLKQVGDTLDQKAATDPHHMATEQLADFPNETFILVRRHADGTAEWHGTQIDIIWVLGGSATLIVGGTLENSVLTAPNEKRGGSIQGGVREKLSAGDVVRIPPRTPHQILLDGSSEVAYLVIKGKGY